MSNSSDLVARVKALEKAVHSLLGAVNLLETLFEKNGVARAGRRATSAAKKKRAPEKKRVSKNKR